MDRESIKSLIRQEIINENISQFQTQRNTFDSENLTFIESKISESIESKFAALESRILKKIESEKTEQVNQNNYTTRGTYEGQEVRFALSGQVLTPEEAVEFGNINYIEFGGDGGNFAFRLFPTTTGGTDPEPRIGVQYGEINGQPPSGMTQNDPFLLDCGTAKIWARITFDGASQITARTLEFGSSIPSDTATNVYVLIGNVEYSTTNESYTVQNQTHAGNINIRRYSICVNGQPKYDWFFVGARQQITVT